MNPGRTCRESLATPGMDVIHPCAVLTRPPAHLHAHAANSHASNEFSKSSRRQNRLQTLIVIETGVSSGPGFFPFEL
jgi:hypothetical protein